MWTDMQTDEGPQQQPAHVVTAQATGVMVLALRTPPDVANRALVAAAHRHGVPVEDLAAAVVASAGGSAGGVNPGLRRAVSTEWGDLLD